MTDHENIVAKLISATGKKEIQWPSKITCTPLDGERGYRLSLAVVDGNMQDDSIAFEGWALALKVWLKLPEEKVVELHWKDPSLERKTPEYAHYQRFLYRVILFKQAVSWFSISDESLSLLEDSETLHPTGSLKNDQLKINYGKDSDRNIKPNYVFPLPPETHTENDLEKFFTINTDPLFKCLKVKEGTNNIKRQLPVGVFDGGVKSETRIFSGNSSAIDLCVLTEGGETVVLELKKDDNRKVGGISELLFYSHVVRDVQSRKINYVNRLKEDCFEKRMKECEAVKGYLFAGDIHPLLDNKAIFEELNRCFLSRQQSYGYLHYKLDAFGDYECKVIYS